MTTSRWFRGSGSLESAISAPKVPIVVADVASCNRLILVRVRAVLCQLYIAAATTIATAFAVFAGRRLTSMQNDVIIKTTRTLQVCWSTIADYISSWYATKTHVCAARNAAVFACTYPPATRAYNWLVSTAKLTKQTHVHIQNVAANTCTGFHQPRPSKQGKTTRTRGYVTPTTQYHGRHILSRPL